MTEVRESLHCRNYLNRPRSGFFCQVERELLAKAGNCRLADEFISLPNSKVSKDSLLLLLVFTVLVFQVPSLFTDLTNTY